MKVEMGESLFYSWLRHVKKCQIVQTNWKPSTQWPLHNEEALQQMMHESARCFQDEYQCDVFKKTSSFKQFLKQAEIDAVGLSLKDGMIEVHAVDVAFHEGGLMYGATRQEASMIIAKKCLRAAMCLHGYLNTKSGSIVFASPKIGSLLLNDIENSMKHVRHLLAQAGLNFNVSVYSNETFDAEVLTPLLDISKGVADTSELFLRSFQLCSMFRTIH